MNDERERDFKNNVTFNYIQLKFFCGQYFKVNNFDRSNWLKIFLSKPSPFWTNHQENMSGLYSNLRFYILFSLNYSTGHLISDRLFNLLEQSRV